MTVLSVTMGCNDAVRCVVGLCSCSDEGGELGVMVVVVVIDPCTKKKTAQGK